MNEARIDNDLQREIQRLQENLKSLRKLNAKQVARNMATEPVIPVMANFNNDIEQILIRLEGSS